MRPRANRSFLRARAAVLLAAALLASIAACDPAASPSPSSQGADAPQWEPQTAWERAVVAVDEHGEYSKDAALALFATAYGPLPGVDVQQDLTGVSSRTLAIRAISRVEDQLSDEQKAAIEAYLAPPANATKIEIPPVAAMDPWRLVNADPGLAQALREVAEQARLDIAAKIGDFDGFLHVWFVPRPADVKPIDGIYPNGGAQPQYLFGQYQGCYITIYDEATAQSGLQLTALMTHEVFHCFQQAIERTRAKYDTIPNWISEGQATWVGMELGGPSPNYSRFWDKYLVEPQTSLITRSYDAVGFYAHLQESGIDPWTVFRPMIEADTDLARYLAAKADAESFVDSWASSVLRDEPLGSPWNTTGPGITDTAYKPGVQVVNNGTNIPLSQPFFTNDITRFVLDADLVEIQVDGHARLRNGSVDTALHGAAKYCVAGHDCAVACPGEEAPQYDTIQPSVFLAESGGHEGLVGHIRGIKAGSADDCEEDPEPEPPEPGGGEPGGGNGVSGSTPSCETKCGQSNGDVHVSTFGEHGYDFQAVGEFVLARSADGRFEVQTRQAPLGDSRNVSINTALAVRAGDHRMALYIDVEDGTVRLTVDGAPTDMSAPVPFGSGLITRTPEGAHIDAGDGFNVWVIGRSYRGFNLLIDPGDGRADGIVGLMGPNPSDSLYPRLPDGSSVGATTFDPHENYVQLYQTLADGWRVTDANSLFDYEPGESSETFQRRNFPTELDLVLFDHLTEAQKAAGEAACKNVTDPELHRMCVYDVGVTADTGYGEQYEQQITLLESGSLGTSGERVRVVNLYTNGGVGTALDVYAWAGDASLGGTNPGTGPALVATVPYGQASAWFDPGQMSNGTFAPVNWISAQRQGEAILGWQFNLFDLPADSRAGTERVIVIVGDPDGLSIPGGTAASWNQVLEEAPEGYFPLIEPPAGKALGFLNTIGMYEIEQNTYWSVSVDGRCLTDPEFPTLAQVVQGTSYRPAQLEPGSYEVAVHRFPQGEDSFDLNCGRFPVAASANVTVAAGERLHLFVFAEQPGAPVQLLAVPVGD